MWYLDMLEANLSEIDKVRLQDIYEPKIICIPPDDARRGLCVMPDGELRYYGRRPLPGMEKTIRPTNTGAVTYFSSRNCGLDWERIDLPVGPAPIANWGRIFSGKPMMLSGSRIPWSQRYVNIFAIWEEEGRGTYAMYSDKGPGDPNPEIRKISDRIYFDIQPPVALPGNRMITACSYAQAGVFFPHVLYTDDDGETWREVPLNQVPEYDVTWPNLGVRWRNNGAEPNLVELPDGQLMLLMRNSQDYFYVYYSPDRGETWTQGKPSIFHGTLTTSRLLRLRDGRVLVFWNNTRPFPEENHELSWPPVDNGVHDGTGEDTFTNRDACHCAISEDGTHWIGFRELCLNPARGLSDFRTRGSADNSVQQFQAMELPFNKVLVAFGQHEVSRRLVIFDVNWLYERGNSENFFYGLEHVSTHLFVKSVSGSKCDLGIPGHCSWNRTDGALLVPDPEGNFREVLQLCRVRDERLVSDRQGMVWNFPMAYSGTVRAVLRVSGAGIRFCLCDHWCNPSDPYVPEYALFYFDVDRRLLGEDRYYSIEVKFDTAQRKATVLVDGVSKFSVRMRCDAPTGVSYVHLQTLAEDRDFQGTYIREIEMIP